MAFNVTILSVDDVIGQVQVLFEDTSSDVQMKMGIPIGVEYDTEDELLDYLVTQWPYEVFDQRGKAPADRHKQAKAAVGITKNVTGKVNQVRP